MMRWWTLLCIPLIAVGYVLIRIYWPFSVYQCQRTDHYVFLGDSITRGTVGDSYLNYLGVDNYCNTSKNGQTIEGVYQTLLGLDLDPGQKLILMIGGNDARLESSPSQFSDTLVKIIKQVKNKGALLLIATPPFVNETMETPTNQRLLLLMSLMRNVALEMNIQFIDSGTLGKVPQGVIDNWIHIHPSFINSLQRYLLFMEWDEIASSHAMTEYIDRFHLSNKGAKLLAERIKENSQNYFQ